VECRSKNRVVGPRWLSVVFIERDGEVYDRAQQYSDRSGGVAKPNWEWFWEGSRKKKPTGKMRASLQAMFKGYRCWEFVKRSGFGRSFLRPRE
jgi:hypothetical protein